MSSVINALSESINDPACATQFRTDPQRAHRSRLLPFPCLVAFLIHHLRSAAQLELDAFFGHLAGVNTLFRVVTASALSHARRWLQHEVFIHLLDRLLLTCRARGVFDQPDWRGFRLVAADGSAIYLPRVQALAQAFGAYCRDGELSYLQARALVLLDCASGLFLGATMEDDRVGERELLVRLLDRIPARGLLLLDRGYPALWLYALLVARAQPFVMRADLQSWAACKTFLSSGALEQRVTFTPSRQQGMEMVQHGLPIEPVTLRLVRRGKDQVVVTSLLDELAYPAAEIAELYTDRWKVETALGILKKPCAVEAFSGRTALAIRQDFHAAILRSALLAVTLLDAQAKLREQEARAEQERLQALAEQAQTQEQDQEQRWEQEGENPALPKPRPKGKPQPKTVNATHTISALRRLLPSLLFRVPERLQQLLAAAESSIEQMIDLATQTLHTPGKPRPRQMKKKAHHAQPPKYVM